MSNKKRRNPRPQLPSRRYPARRVATWIACTLTVVALFAVAVMSTGKQSSAANRLKSGPAPAFAAQDIVSGRLVTSSIFKRGNTLLFFSEGVMCQACLEQIQSLERISGQLTKRHLALVSITPDSPEQLRQAVADYKIHTPLLTDESRRMSTDYDVLGLGMHADMPGHTFILVDRKGKIRWRHDYTKMFVPVKELLAAIPRG
ncbi:MAG: peroxiredoxin family protein [Gaiellaceae bacterium]